MKACSGCGVQKEERAFDVRRASRDGLSPRCKVCASATNASYRAKNLAKIAVQQAAYYKSNRERKRAYDRTYYVNNRDVIRAAAAKWVEDNKERARATWALWKAAHPEAPQKWYLANRERKLAQNRNRHARKKNAGGTHTEEDIAKFLTLQRGCCAACKTNVLKIGFVVDHVVPLARGGHNGPGNLQLLCAPCNGRKHAKDPVAFMQELGYLL